MARASKTELTNVFTVELWNDDETAVVDTLATAGNFHIARAAFDEARARHPGRPILIRHGIRIVLASRGRQPSASLPIPGNDVG
jgi:hypothetical protein